MTEFCFSLPAPVVWIFLAIGVVHGALYGLEIWYRVKLYRLEKEREKWRA